MYRVKTDAAAIDWESKLVTIAQSSVGGLTDRTRRESLGANKEALRRAVKQYVAHLDLSNRFQL